MGKQLTPNFYQDRVCLSVLAGSHQNAKEIYQAAETYVVVGVLSKNYADLNSAILKIWLNMLMKSIMHFLLV